jgi:type II secretory pathway pseudopilin PulG
MKTRKAFTLIELLLYIGLLAIVITAVTGFTVDVISTRTKTHVIVEVEQNARFSLLRILRSIRQATDVNNGGSTFNNDNGVLALAQSATSTDPAIFDLSAGAIRLKEGSGTATPLTTAEVTVTKLRFSKDNVNGGKAITALIELKYNTNNTTSDYDYVISTSGTAVIRKQ